MSTVQFMTVVHVEEPKESEFSRCPSLADDDTHKMVCEWLGEIKKAREMNQDARRQVNDDKIYTSEKHFNPENIEICEYSFENSPTITCTLDRNVLTRS